MEKRNQPIRVVLGENIRAYRNKKNMSQEKLAEISGLHRTYISAIARGIRNVSIDNIQKLADALEVETHILVMNTNKGEIDENIGNN